MNRSLYTGYLFFVLAAGMIPSCQPKSAVTIDAPTPSPLLKVSQGLSMMSAVTAESVLAVIDMNKNNLLDKGQTVMLLDVLEKVAHGGKEATDAVRKLNSLSDADRKSLSLVVEPMLAAVNDGLVLVANMGPESQIKARAVLLAIQSTLAVVQASLEVR